MAPDKTIPLLSGLSLHFKKVLGINVIKQGKKIKINTAPYVMNRNGIVLRMDCVTSPPAMLQARYKIGATGGVMPPTIMVMRETMAKCNGSIPA